MVICLSAGRQALVDDDLPANIFGRKWTFDGRYAYRMTQRKKIYLHREILTPAPGLMIDHINGNKLDNRRVNLREVTRSQNGHNVKSVNVYRKCGKWQARVTVNYRCRSLGVFLKREDATLAVERFKMSYLRGGHG